MVIAITLAAALGLLPQQDSLLLSLDDAVRIAREANPALLAQRAAARAQAQAPLEASQAFLPSLRLGVTGMRTTDPVAVFGMKLKTA